MGVEDEFKKIISQISEMWTVQDSGKPNERKTSRFIFDTIYGEIPIEGFLVDLLDRPPMQRLRWIKQLGTAEMLYPTGSHSRFEHSLGTYYIARQILFSLKKIEPDVNPNDEENVLAAALLHDVGHLCFSHTGELFLRYYSSVRDLIEKFRIDGKMKTDISIHEYIGHEILNCKYFKEIIRSLSDQYGIGLDTERIGELIIGDHTNRERQFLADIIHGPIDADRIDYLLRDAYNVGFPRIIDWHRLINTVTIVDVDNSGETIRRLGIEEKGLKAVESLFLARNRLRPVLYEHHLSRVSEEVMIRIMRESIENPFDIMWMDDYDLFCRVKNSGRLEELLSYKNRKFFKRFLFFQCTDENLEDDVAGTPLKRRIEIEKEISNKIWNEEHCCIMVIPKTREKANIGEILVKRRDNSVEKASVSLNRLYHKKYLYEPAGSRDSDRSSEFEICETYDIRLFVPWNKISEPFSDKVQKVKEIFSEQYSTEPKYFQEEYSPREYRGYSLRS